MAATDGAFQDDTLFLQGEQSSCFFVDYLSNSFQYLHFLAAIFQHFAARIKPKAPILPFFQRFKNFINIFYLYNLSGLQI